MNYTRRMTHNDLLYMANLTFGGSPRRPSLRGTEGWVATPNKMVSHNSPAIGVQRSKLKHRMKKNRTWILRLGM